MWYLQHHSKLKIAQKHYLPHCICRLRIEHRHIIAFESVVNNCTNRENKRIKINRKEITPIYLGSVPKLEPTSSTKVVKSTINQDEYTFSVLTTQAKSHSRLTVFFLTQIPENKARFSLSPDSRFLSPKHSLCSLVSLPLPRDSGPQKNYPLSSTLE